MVILLFRPSFSWASETFRADSSPKSRYILTYEEFQFLSKIEKKEYLRGLSKWLTKLDANQRLQSLHNFWSLIFNTAVADGLSDFRCLGGGVPVSGTQSNCGVTAYAGYSCSSDPNIQSGTYEPGGLEICNPVLFGVRRNGQPFCFANATTETCFDSIRVGVDSTLDFLDTESGREAFDQFAQDINRLCTGQATVQESANSLEDACNLARRQVNVNRTRQLAIYRDLPEAPGTETPPARDIDPTPSAVSTGGCTLGLIGQDLQDYQVHTSSPRAFVESLTPLALEIQAVTGFPASILISKAALETGWGRSRLARTRNNFAGMSCFTGLTTQWSVSQISFAGNRFPIQRRCGSARPASEGGGYQEYRSQMDSLLDSINLLAREDSPYNDRRLLRSRGIHSTLNENLAVLRRGPNAQAHRNILTILDRVYAPDQRDCSRCPSTNNNYDGTLLSIIRSHNLDDLDRAPVCGPSHSVRDDDGVNVTI